MGQHFCWGSRLIKLPPRCSSRSSSYCWRVCRFLLCRIPATVGAIGLLDGLVLVVGTPLPALGRVFLVDYLHGRGRLPCLEVQILRCFDRAAGWDIDFVPFRGGAVGFDGG